MRKFLYSALEIIEAVVVAVGVVVVIRSFLVQPFIVSGDSMDPNFQNGNYLLVDEMTYRFRAPERGEVIVFHYPEDPSIYFIKRIIGLPGEKVVIKNDEVTIYNTSNPQGFVLSESYLPKSVITSGDETFNLSQTQYLVLGDNRQFSYDSREWGLLNKSLIVGLVRLRLWPANELTAFAAPSYAK
ncbi:MAG: signal peptidase I [Patescibacteria group bacterium]|nr:signal peptidase I [Patescibacteria group bacterium]